MEKYKNAHKWLFIPFVIAIIGFMPSYYLRFTDALWGHHLHGLSATLWYLFVIYQPYLISKQDIQRHKKSGIFGVFLAGLVVASALAMLPGNLQGAAEQLASGEISQIAPPFFLYGITLFDLVAILGFGVSVIMAIRNSKDLDNHAIWMIATVFWALMPALARLALIPMFISGNITHFANVAMAVTPLILIAIGIIMYRLKTMHVALVAVFLCNLLSYVIVPLGKSEWWINFATAVFTAR